MIRPRTAPFPPGAVPRPPAPGRPSVLSPPVWLDRFPRQIKLRPVVLGLIILTYVWRFHDLAPFIGPLRLAAISTVLSWVFLVFQPRWGTLSRAAKLPYVWAFLVWSVWILISAQYALNSAVANAYWQDVHLTSMTMFLFVLLSLEDLRHVQLAIVAHVIGAFIGAFFYAKGGFPTWGSPMPQYDVNEFALLLLMTLPFVIFFATTEENSKLRLAFWGLAVLMTIAVLMTRSRGGFLTTGVLLGILLVRGRGLSLKARILPPIVLLIGFSFLPADVTDRLSTLFNPSEDYNVSDEEGRVEIWKRGLGYLEDRPVFGVGALNFPIAEITLSARAQAGGIERGFVTHNAFLQVASETGVLGGGLFIFMIVSAMWRMRSLAGRYKKRPDPESQDFVLLCDMTQLSFVAFCVGGFFLSVGYGSMLLAMVAITAGVELNAPKGQTAPVLMHRRPPRMAPTRPRRSR